MKNSNDRVYNQRITQLIRYLSRLDKLINRQLSNNFVSFMGCSNSEHQEGVIQIQSPAAFDHQMRISPHVRNYLLNLSINNSPLQTVCSNCGNNYAKILQQQHLSICKLQRLLKQCNKKSKKKPRNSNQERKKKLQQQIDSEVTSYKLKFKIVQEIYLKSSTKSPPKPTIIPRTTQKKTSSKRQEPKLEQVELLRNQGDLCPVCFQQLQKGETAVVLGCGHKYHKPCLAQCIMKTGKRQCVVDRSQLR